MYARTELLTNPYTAEDRYRRMAEHASGDESDIVHWTFEPEQNDPTIDVAAVVAELEGKETTDLSTLYDRVDSVLDDVFADPPAPEAQFQVAFTYEGYRITINQDGSATFLKVD